jgi:hypothetical protein
VGAVLPVDRVDPRAGRAAPPAGRAVPAVEPRVARKAAAAADFLQEEVARVVPSHRRADCRRRVARAEVVVNPVPLCHQGLCLRAVAALAVDPVPAGSRAAGKPAMAPHQVQQVAAVPLVRQGQQVVVAARPVPAAPVARPWVCPLWAAVGCPARAYPHRALVAPVAEVVPMGAARKAVPSRKVRAALLVARPRRVFSRAPAAAADLPVLPVAARVLRVDPQVVAVPLAGKPVADFQEHRAVLQEADSLAAFQAQAAVHRVAVRPVVVVRREVAVRQAAERPVAAAAVEVR